MSTRKISDQLGYSKLSAKQDRYLGPKLTGRQTAEALEYILGLDGSDRGKGPKDVPGS